MFGRPKKVEDVRLEDAIIRILDDMEKVDPSTDEYATLLTQVERFYNLRTTQISKAVSPDVMATVLANLMGILVIVAYERTHVFASKAQNFVLKPKP